MKLKSVLSASVIFLSTWLLFLSSASAASLYIDPGMSTLNRGDSITMAVRLDTDESVGECINAVDGVITYSTNIEPIDISTGDSIFNIWVEQPKINKENRTITFAGGIPNGYCGRVIGDPRLSNVLTKIVFQSPGFSISTGAVDENNATIEFSDESTAYLNDGRGTKASLMTYGAAIELNQRPGAVMVNEWKDEVSADKIPPEEFSISLQKDEKAFSQKYYIVFNTTDKQTGVDHYEVMEEPLMQLSSFEWGRADAPWIKTRSPYVLKDQSLNSTIRVKAVDKAGNVYIASLIPDESLRTTPQGQVVTMVFIAVGVIFMLVFGYFIFRYVVKKRRKRVNDPENNLEDEIEDYNEPDNEYADE